MNNIMRTCIIAEAGVNHNGSLELAKSLIDAAAEAGADIVKFQTFTADKLVSRTAKKADYQAKTTDAEESQWQMIKKLELDYRAHEILIEHCRVRGVQFLSTPFDFESVDLLTTKFNLATIKVPSGEITNGPLLLKIAQTQKPVILSTGMSTLGDIEVALGVLAFGYLNDKEPSSAVEFREAYASEAGQQVLRERVILLHCTTEYPTPLEEVNLRVLDTLRNAFGLPVGYSDHSAGIVVPIAAVARGAVIIEKHFTLDRNLPGPDHKASLEPGELKQMIQAIRDVELALGSAIKKPTPSECKNMSVARKSLIALRAIEKGDLFTADNLDVKRPGDGVTPMHYWDLLGRVAERDYAADEQVKL